MEFLFLNHSLKIEMNLTWCVSIRFARMGHRIARLEATISFLLSSILQIMSVLGFLWMHCPTLLFICKLGIWENELFRFCIAVMALRIVTRRFGSKVLPLFSSANLLHSHATSFGWFISLSLGFWVLPMLVFEFSILIMYLNRFSFFFNIRKCLLQLARTSANLSGQLPNPTTFGWWEDSYEIKYGYHGLNSLYY